MGQKIREARIAAGFKSAGAFARAIKTSRQTVEAWELGKHSAARWLPRSHPDQDGKVLSVSGLGILQKYFALSLDMTR